MDPYAWPLMQPTYIEQVRALARAVVDAVRDEEGTSGLGEPIGISLLVERIGNTYLDQWRAFPDPVGRIGCWTGRELARWCVPALSRPGIPPDQMDDHFDQLLGLIGAFVDEPPDITDIVLEWIEMCPMTPTPVPGFFEWCNSCSDDEATAVAVGCSVLVARALEAGLIREIDLQS